MPSLKTRPDNLDFLFTVHEKENYFIPSLVLVQSILENNLWANQIQISIFYENWSPDQKNAYQKLADNFNKFKGESFVTLNLLDFNKFKLETIMPFHNFSGHNIRIEGLKYIKPISNWVFSIEANELNIRSLEPLVLKLNQDYSDCWAIRQDTSFFRSTIDFSYYPYFPGYLFIFNSKFISTKGGIVERYISNDKKIQNTYPDFYGKIINLSWFENNLGIALNDVPLGSLIACLPQLTSLNQVTDSTYFLKWGSMTRAPWNKEFPDNSLKRLWFEYASKNPMSKDFQIPFPYIDERSSIKKIADSSKEHCLKILIIFYNFLRKSFRNISPKMFHKLTIFYFKLSLPKNNELAHRVPPKKS